ncbi:hypothetical protein NMG60_11032140 [Bertholletia excelsa]
MQFSVFGSILNIGAILGAIACGRITDLLGRKGAMRLSSFVCAVGWLAIYLAMGPGLLELGRFLTGFGIGIFSFAVPVFIGEITPTDLRGTLTSMNLLLLATGTSSFYIIGAFISWRALALIGILPSLIQYIGLFIIPESPRWLAMVGKEGEFEAALQKLRGPRTDTSLEVAEIREHLSLRLLEYLEEQKGLPDANLFTLFERSNVRPVIVAVGVMAFQQLVGINAVYFYANMIFKSAGLDPTTGSIIYAILQVIVTAIGAALVDKAGRRPLLLSHGMALGLVPSMALSGVLVFPLHIKGLGGSLVTFVNWFGSWLETFAFNFLIAWSSAGTFLVDGVFCALAVIFFYKYVPETKGRTLEEIHASMRS